RMLRGGRRDLGCGGHPVSVTPPWHHRGCEEIRRGPLQFPSPYSPCSAHAGPRPRVGSEGGGALAMRAYELMVIIDAELEDEVIDATVKRIADMLGQRGATVRSEDRWGRRRFAYE